MDCLLFFSVSLLASVIGAICGVGGGIIIKPTLDLLGLASVATVNFLSGCTVLSMSCYSVGKAMLAGDSSVDIKTGTPLALGAAMGGVVGRQMFTAIKRMFDNPNMVGRIQALCLAVITLGTLLYTLNKGKIKTHRVKHFLACTVIGLILGIMSSFLGIGGGPINLVVLYYFFSMDTKTAASNSLYIILFSQSTSLLMTLISRTIPPFRLTVLVLMVIGGILGGVIGRKLNKKLNNTAVDRLFIGLMVVIIGISVYNVWQYSQ